MLEFLEDARLRRILVPAGGTGGWRGDLQRLIGGDESLTRRSAGEAGIRAVQRLLVFLGYSTSSDGAFVIDGDFGRGTNRGLAHFQFEHGLRSTLRRQDLCYPCTYSTARKRITAVPDTRLDVKTLDALGRTALEAIDLGEIPLGRLENALFHLDALDERRALHCSEILRRYGAAAEASGQAVLDATGVDVRPEWVLAVIRQETAGVIRPRFEQHKLSSLNRQHPRTSFAELRFRSMSIGLGQIMGFNHELVGAPSAQAMIRATEETQVLYVARFLARKPHVVDRLDPDAADFRDLARYYNGPRYRSHYYDEHIARWFREFRLLRAS